MDSAATETAVKICINEISMRLSRKHRQGSTYVRLPAPWTRLSRLLWILNSFPTKRSRLLDAASLLNRISREADSKSTTEYFAFPANRRG